MTLLLASAVVAFVFALGAGVGWRVGNQHASTNLARDLSAAAREIPGASDTLMVITARAAAKWAREGRL